MQIHSFSNLVNVGRDGSVESWKAARLKVVFVFDSCLLSAPFKLFWPSASFRSFCLNEAHQMRRYTGEEGSTIVPDSL